MTKEGIKLVRIFNGELEGQFASKVFDLGENGEFVLDPIYIIIAVAGVVVIAGVVVALVLVSKKKKANKQKEENVEENA